MKISIKMKTTHEIMLLSKIIESCGHIGMVKTTNGSQGLAEILCTNDTYLEIKEILALFPGSVNILFVH